jgi:hypothetical protein
MLAGADSIDDCDVLRAGAASELFDDTRAPSTVGTWLRAFRWSHVRQLDAVARHATGPGATPWTRDRGHRGHRRARRHATRLAASSIPARAWKS